MRRLVCQSIQSTRFRLLQRSRLFWPVTAHAARVWPGFTQPPDFFVKLTGQNVTSNFELDEDGSLGRELWLSDFDGPTGSTNTLSDGLTLGNHVEVNVGGGDSGGPNFLWNDINSNSTINVGELTWWGNNTFGLGGGSIPAAPFFGSQFGGMVGATYWSWLDNIIGFDYLNLAFSPGSISENGGTSTATVSRLGGDISQSLVVDLASNDTSEATVPATVTIAANQASNTFTITAVDDTLLDGTQTPAITASASGISSAMKTIDVTDHETLTVTIDVSSMSENGGTATGTVTRSNTDNGSALVVNLSSNDTTETTVPSTVTIQANQASATFAITAVDDNLLDGTQTATISASATGYVGGSRTINVTDHEPLAITINAPSISENGGSATGTVTRGNTDNGEPLTVTLVSQDTSEATVPSTVVIPPNQASANFPITAIDDNLLDGTQSAAINIVGTSFVENLGVDPWFGQNGYTLTDLRRSGLPATHADVLVDANGSVVVAGRDTTRDDAWKIERFLSNGSVDSTFGTNGAATTVFAGTTQAGPMGLAFDSQQRILVAGANGSTGLLARYLPNGSLDTSFGSGGTIQDSFFFADVVVTANDGVVVFGSNSNGFQLAKFDSNGTLSPSFGTGGYVTTSDASALATTMALQQDGKIVVAGMSSGQHIVLRYVSNGLLDTAFSGNGIANISVSPSGQINSVTIQPDGRIVAVGVIGFTSVNGDWAIHRLLQDGNLDTSFSEDGTHITSFPTSNGVPTTVRVQPDGDIFVGGNHLLSGNDSRMTLVKYRPNGTLDTTFDGDGILGIPKRFQQGEIIYTFELLANDKLVAFVGTPTDLAITRMNLAQKNEPKVYSLQGSSLNVTDYETLTVTFNFSAISENGGVATGTVTRGNTDISNARVVDLTSSDTTEATVPASVTILANQASANFTITAVNDNLLDGTQEVTISPASAGYVPVGGPLSVTDDESASLLSQTTLADVIKLLPDTSTGSYRVLTGPTAIPLLGPEWPARFAGSARYDTAGIMQTAQADEFIPIDTARTYALSGWAKAGDEFGQRYQSNNQQSFGFASFDSDLQAILPQHVLKFPGSTDTTLAAALNPGDPVIQLANATGWSNSGAANTRALAWYGYQNSSGQTYADYTYTRNVALDGTNGLWIAGSISGNTITLAEPWSGPALANGTKVRNATGGADSQFVALNSQTVAGIWTWAQHANVFGSATQTNGIEQVDRFRPGTAFIKPVIASNLHGASTFMTWRDVTLTQVPAGTTQAALAQPIIDLSAATGEDQRYLLTIPHDGDYSNYSWTKELVQVDLTKKYTLAARSMNIAEIDERPLGFVSLDSDRKLIHPLHVTKHRFAADTTLAAPLNPVTLHS